MKIRTFNIDSEALRRRLIVGAAGLAVAASLACSPPPRPNILWIVSDTLRADALSCYGGAAKTPNICGLAERGTLFRHAYAGSPWTMPSVTAMMTGNSPAQFARPDPARPLLLRFQVPDSEALLAETLRDSGYETLATIENDVAALSNALQGFGSWPTVSLSVKPSDKPPELRGEPRRYRELRWMLRFLAGRIGDPFLALHWFRDPHAPYRPPAHRLAELSALLAKVPRPLAFYTGLGHVAEPKTGKRKLEEVGPRLSAPERRLLRRLYLIEVESIDQRVGALLAALERSGRAAETLVVFTSDHGEGFGEHGTYLHGSGFYDELVLVPLIVAGPGVAARKVVEAPVSHLDLVPTLAELLGFDPPAPIQGQSLVPWLDPRRRGKPEARPVHIVNPIRQPDSEALVLGRYKLIVDRRRGAMELYDLEIDPRESKNIAGQWPQLVARLEITLRRLGEHNERRRLAFAGSPGELPVTADDEETQRRLKALGYLD